MKYICCYNNIPFGSQVLISNYLRSNYVAMTTSDVFIYVSFIYDHFSLSRLRHHIPERIMKILTHGLNKNTKAINGHWPQRLTLTSRRNYFNNFGSPSNFYPKVLFTFNFYPKVLFTFNKIIFAMEFPTKNNASNHST